MKELARQLIGLLSSLRLTVVLLALSIALVFAATLVQTRMGLWTVQEIYFRSFFIYGQIPGTDVRLPLFPGGYLLGGLLLFNLVAAHLSRFRLNWRHLGLLAAHLGLIILLIGELVTGIFQRDSRMKLDEGETKNYSESVLFRELALVDISNPDFDEVVVIPEQRLAQGGVIQHSKLPFQIKIAAFLPNSELAMRGHGNTAPPHPANRGIGPQLAVFPAAVTHKPNEVNAPTAFIEAISSEGSLGVWLVSLLLAEPQIIEVDGRKFEVALRHQRTYHPFAITLLKFSHDRYPGTQIPKNFSSRVRLVDASSEQDREVLIYMNNPLRHAGLTFYQAGFGNEDRTSILQVVGNPGWLLPYVATLLMGFGLTYHLILRLSMQMKRTSRRAPSPTQPQPSVPELVNTP
jgi:hypothetical protein